MTFDITAYKPANTWLSFPWEANPCNDARNVIRIMGTINSVIERVRFIGHEGTISEGGENYNVGWCLTVSGIQSYIHKHYNIEPVLGSCTVSDCSFEHVAGGINMAYVVNGNVIVTHTVFTGGTSIGAFLWDFVDSTGEFSYNQLERFNFLGFACGQGLVYSIEPEGGAYLGPLPTNALYLIHDNTFFATGISEAIDLWDYMPVKTLDATVKDNDISMDTQTPAESYVGGGICGWPIHDVKIINNKITGITGLAGIYLGGGSTGCMISGNMLGDLKSDKADIWLAQDTSYCMVVAMKDTTVLDEGVNNKIVGS